MFSSRPRLARFVFFANQPRALPVTKPSCIIAPSPGKGRGSVLFRRNRAETRESALFYRA
jgi:hypothetical protein